MRTVLFIAFLALFSHGSCRMKKRITQVGGDCNYTSDNGNIGVEARGISGEVRFFRLNARGQKSRWVSVRLTAIKEVNAAGSVVKSAQKFSASGTTVSWTCGETNETISETSRTREVTVIQSFWSGTREIKPGSNQKVSLQFNAMLFTKAYDVISCPRKFNRTRIVPRGKTLGPNCTVVTVLPGLKWEIVIDKWPYSNPANHLETTVRVGSHIKIGNFAQKKEPKKVIRTRRRAARKIISFAEGYLDNPEAADVSCGDGSISTNNVTVSLVNPKKKDKFMDVKYVFEPTGNDCVLSYDPVANDNQTDSNVAPTTTATPGGAGGTTMAGTTTAGTSAKPTGSTGRGSVLLGAVFAVFFVLVHA